MRIRLGHYRRNKRIMFGRVSWLWDRARKVLTTMIHFVAVGMIIVARMAIISPAMIAVINHVIGGIRTIRSMISPVVVHAAIIGPAMIAMINHVIGGIRTIRSMISAVVDHVAIIGPAMIYLINSVVGGIRTIRSMISAVVDHVAIICPALIYLINSVVGGIGTIRTVMTIMYGIAVRQRMTEAIAGNDFGHTVRVRTTPLQPQDLVAPNFKVADFEIVLASFQIDHDRNRHSSMRAIIVDNALTV
jgi:hypothetical protein